jgi:N-dimethylarginine dimethylaminohydrolase
LVKSKIEARDNALHLDCCFQPIGPNKGLFIRADFEKKQTICIWLLFWEGFHITREEMYTMNSNVFSIDSNVVVSEKTSLD